MISNVKVALLLEYEVLLFLLSLDNLFQTLGTQ